MKINSFYSELFVFYNSSNLLRPKRLDIPVPNAGGFAIIASAENGVPDGPSGLVHAGSKEFIIDLSCFFCIDISDRPEGRNPLFFTISTKTSISKLSMT
jgi:hypothetical protein